MMQGYDIEAAVPFIAKAMRKAGHKNAQQELEDFIRRAIEADMAYMREIDVIDEDGLMGDGEDDDDEISEYEEKIRTKNLSSEIREKLLKEVS